MKSSRAAAAVLKAADEWVSAQEALVATRQVSNDTEAEQEVVDAAGSRLVVAVTRWRSSRKLNGRAARFRQSREG
jgi:hypothetical protein